MAEQPAPSWTLPYVSLRQRIDYLRRNGAKNIRVVFERNGVVQTRFDLLRGYVGLYLALGGGWPALAAASTEQDAPTGGN